MDQIINQGWVEEFAKLLAILAVLVALAARAALVASPQCGHRPPGDARRAHRAARRAHRAARLAREAAVRLRAQALRGPSSRLIGLLAAAIKRRRITPAPVQVVQEVRFGDLVPTRTPALAAFLAFVLVTFGGIALACAEPTAPAAPPVPAPAPEAPAPAHAPVILVKHAKRDEDTPDLDAESDSLYVPSPQIDTSRSAVPNASLQAKVNVNPGAPAVHAEVDYLLSAGRLGVELIEEFLGSNAKAREVLKGWMVERGCAPESVYETDFELSAQCWQINKPEDEASLIAWASVAHAQGIGVFQGPNSALAIRCWQERGGKQVPTALAALVDTIGDTVNIQQYALSALSARAAGPGFVNAHGVPTIDMEQAGVVVVGWDLTKPIGTTTLADGTQVPLYLEARGADGQLLVTLAEEGRAGAKKGFQVRGAVMADHGWVIPKGAVVPVEGLRAYRGELWTPQKDGWTEEVRTLGQSVLVLDPNTVPKGAAKAEVEHGRLVNCPVAAWSVVDWADGVNRPLEETSMSFQITCFMLRKWLGDEVWDRMIVDKGVIEAAREAMKLRAERDGLDNQASYIKLLEEAGVEATAEHLALLAEQPLNLQDDLMSSGTCHRTRTLKVLASSTIPHGSVILDEQYVGVWQMEETIQRVAMSRMPALNPLSITAPYIISWQRLQRFAALVETGSVAAAMATPLPSEGGEATGTYGDWIMALLKRNDFIVKLNKWESQAALYGQDVDGFVTRLLYLAREQEGAYLAGVVRVNPLDGTVRNEDNDGDSSTACTKPLSVNLYNQVEELWNRWDDRLAIELPKDQKMKWADRKFAKGFVELGLECHPKAARLISAKPRCFPLVPAPSSLPQDKVAAFALAVVNTTAVNPQGPVGMWSNVAAELFMNIEWELTTDGVLQPKAERSNIRMYHAWVFAAVHVQFSIDWQKRAYPLLSIIHYAEVAKLFLKGGDEAAKAYNDLVSNGQLDLESTVEIYGENVRELGANWCTEPLIPYTFAAIMLNGGDWTKPPKRKSRQKPCAWKRSPTKGWDFEQVGRFLDRVPQESVFTQAVRSAIYDGWLLGLEEAERNKLTLLDRWTRTTKASTVPARLLAGSMAQALREIAAINGKLGDSNALRKITASQVLRTWMSLAAGATREQQDQLLEGKEVEIEGLTWKRSDFIVAAFTHRPKLGQLSLLAIVLESIGDSAKKPAVVQAMARVATAVQRMLRPGDGWLTSRALAHLPQNSWERFTLTDPAQWRTENVTQQNAIWKALAQAINANLGELETALWKVLSTQSPSEGAPTYLDALLRDKVIEMENLRASLADRKAQCLKARNAIKDKRERNALRDKSGNLVTPEGYAKLLKSLRHQLADLDREWADEVRAAEREMSRTLEAVFAPVKKLYVAINAMSSYGCNRYILQLSHNGWVKVKRGITVSGGAGMAFLSNAEANRHTALRSEEVKADLAKGKRRWEELRFTDKWQFASRKPSWAESGGIAGYNLRTTTDPRVALDRWAANPQAIGPVAPRKAAIEFAGIAMAQGPVKSYSAFGSGQIMTWDLWIAASRDAEEAGASLPFNRINGVRAIGAASHEVKDNAFIQTRTPQLVASGNFLVRLATADGRLGRGCILPWEADAKTRASRFYSVAAIAAMLVAIEALQADQDSEDVDALLSPDLEQLIDPDSGEWLAENLEQFAEQRWGVLAHAVWGLIQDAADGLYTEAVQEGIYHATHRAFLASRLAHPKPNSNGRVSYGAALAWADAAPGVIAGWRDFLAEYGWR